ncbi:hypothetical protein AaE_002924 [Aphanomyces astaci]|uniref:DDE Tnp4 domain-containing protein n=1 Tax=Aphanomyces astaci TaxID=112090 RepID=A0A6A5AMD0_APHAT|nr:hypothetical protein AaE_002924 [Aphanomyces astaci]
MLERLNDTCDSSIPIIDHVLQESGDEGFRVMTNFTAAEFQVLWDIIQVQLTARWTEGRGSKSKTSPKDALFMILTVLKHYQAWEKHEIIDFGFKAPTFQKMVLRVIEVVEPVFSRYFVHTPTMSELRAKNKLFDNYPYAMYATDVKFHPTERPGGRDGEAKVYFSGKHKLYGLKIEVSVSPEGLMVDMSNYELGSVADLTILRSRLAVHRQALKKSDEELNIEDHGEQAGTHGSMWAFLVDKGYYGVMTDLRGVHPKKNPPRGLLERDDVERNRQVSADRVLVENVFGRV